MTSEQTFQRVLVWIEEIFDRVGRLIPTAIVTNKVDIRVETDQAVPAENELRYVTILNENFSSVFIYEETNSISGDNCRETTLKPLKLRLAILEVYCYYRCESNQFAIRSVKNRIYCLTFDNDIDIDKKRAFNRLRRG